jgi:flagellar basal-body rod protein FlgB
MNMEPISTAVILKALDGLSIRAAATAQNIANANSPGYKPIKVTFEEALRAAAPSGAVAITAVQPQMVAAFDQEGRSALRIDLELATATATAGRYGTLIELLNRQLQMDALAVSGNR